MPPRPQRYVSNKKIDPKSLLRLIRYVFTYGPDGTDHGEIPRKRQRPDTVNKTPPPIRGRVFYG